MHVVAPNGFLKYQAHHCVRLPPLPWLASAANGPETETALSKSKLRGTFGIFYRYQMFLPRPLPLPSKPRPPERARMAATAFVVCPNPKSELFSPAGKPWISHYTPALSFDTRFSPSRLRVAEKSLRFRRCSVVQDIAAVEEEQKGDEKEGRRQENRQKLYVVNLPWNFLAADIKKLFGECGTVESVEIIKQKNGKSRGFAFVTMASEEEALAAIDKLDSYELMGRIIRVEFAKSFRKPPSPPPPPGATAVDTQQKIYVSNLSWKARSVNLKEFFSAKFKPLSARVVFENPSGRSAGYGFVAFATKEEADAAISELDGKELMGRPVRLKLRQKKGDESGSEPEELDNTEGQSNNS